MRKLVLSLAAATALTFASGANAAISIGATSGPIIVGTPNNSTMPEKVTFDTTTNSSGSVSPWFEFSNDLAGSYTFALITSTGGATVTLERLLSGGGSSIIQTMTGTGDNLKLTTGVLDPNTTYRFLYTFNAGSGGGAVSGNASFTAVPEPATWAMMLIGFCGIGMAMRRRRSGSALAQLA